MEDVAPDGRTAMVEQLHQVVRALNGLWWEALTHGPGEATIGLTDASQAVHRALIVLGAYEPQGSVPC